MLIVWHKILITSQELGHFNISLASVNKEMFSIKSNIVKLKWRNKAQAISMNIGYLKNVFCQKYQINNQITVSINH